MTPAALERCAKLSRAAAAVLCSTRFGDLSCRVTYSVSSLSSVVRRSRFGGILSRQSTRRLLGARDLKLAAAPSDTSGMAWSLSSLVGFGTG